MQTLRQCQPVGLCLGLGQKLVEIPFEGSTKAMAQSSASNVTPIHRGGILTAGLAAPNFTLHVTPDQTLTLSDLLGRPVILAFYPADWSPVRIRTRISPSPATSARQ